MLGIILDGETGVHVVFNLDDQKEYDQLTDGLEQHCIGYSVVRVDEDGRRLYAPGLVFPEPVPQSLDDDEIPF